MGINITFNTDVLDKRVQDYFTNRQPVTWRELDDGWYELWAYSMVPILKIHPETCAIILADGVELSKQTGSYYYDYDRCAYVYPKHVYSLYGLKDSLVKKLIGYLERQIKHLFGQLPITISDTNHRSVTGDVVTKATDAVVDWLYDHRVIDPEVLSQAAKAIYNANRGRLSIHDYNFTLVNQRYHQEMVDNLPAAVSASFSSFYYELTPEQKRTPMPDLMKQVKAHYMAQHQLTNALWKRLLALKQKDQEWYTAHNTYGEVGPRHVLTHHTRYNKFPRVTALKALRDFLRDNWNVRERMPADWRQVFIQEMLAGSREALNIRQWAANEFYQVKDWVRSPEGLAFRPDRNQMSAKWGWFVRKAEEWHDTVALRRLEENAAGLNQGDVVANDPRTWASEFYEMKLGAPINIYVVALTRAVDLAIEGHSMAHCVGGYSQGCMEGHSRIFSLRVLDGELKGNRIATCQIVKSSSSEKWRLEQIRGKRNADVTPEVKQVGEAIAVAYTEAYKKRLAAEEAERKRLEEIAKEEERKRKEEERKAEIARREAEKKARELEEQKRAEGAKKMLITAEINTNVVLLPTDEIEKEKLNVG